MITSIKIVFQRIKGSVVGNITFPTSKTLRPNPSDIYILYITWQGGGKILSDINIVKQMILK